MLGGGARARGRRLKLELDIRKAIFGGKCVGLHCPILVLVVRGPSDKVPEYDGRIEEYLQNRQK